MTQNKSEPDSYMVDGKFRSSDEVYRIFNNGEINFNNLPVRQSFSLDYIQKLLPLGRLLDVGCYAGTFIKAITLRYPSINAVGVDYYPDNIRIARCYIRN